MGKSSPLRGDFPIRAFSALPNLETTSQKAAATNVACLGDPPRQQHCRAPPRHRPSFGELTFTGPTSKARTFSMLFSRRSLPRRADLSPPPVANAYQVQTTWDI